MTQLPALAYQAFRWHISHGDGRFQVGSAKEEGAGVGSFVLFVWWSLSEVGWAS